jgi:hypothetical protein
MLEKRQLKRKGDVAKKKDSRIPSVKGRRLNSVLATFTLLAGA